MREIDRDPKENSTQSTEGQKETERFAKNVAKCQTNTRPITDTSSLRISRSLTGQGKATGYWTGTTATEAQTITYTVGITSE